MCEQNENKQSKRVHKGTLGRRLDSIGWGLFFIMLGVLWIMPEGIIHKDFWLIGMGAIIFVISGIRYLNNLRVSMFWTAIGLFVLTSGISSVYGLSLPVFQVVLIFIGLSIILRPRRGYGYWNCCRMMRWRRYKRRSDIIE